METLFYNLFTDIPPRLLHRLSHRMVMVLYVLLSAFLLLLNSSCGQNSASATPAEDRYFFIGTYSRDNSQGIYAAILHPDGTMGALKAVAPVSNPSFLRKTANGRVLLAVSEEEAGELLSFRIQGDTLIPADKALTGGAHPCHISIQQNELAVVSNYTGGNIALFEVGKEGELSLAGHRSFSGNGPHWRQDAPHAHSSFFMDKLTVATVDLGTDNIHMTQLDTTNHPMRLNPKAAVSLKSGSGPRHLAIHPSGNHAYVINELSSEITRLTYDPEEKTWNPAESISTLPEDFEGENLCADIHIDPKGEYLYASNRGHQSLAIYRIDPTSGKLTRNGIASVHGEWPRNFAIAPDGQHLLVANEHSGNVVSFRIHPEKGSLEKTDEINVPAPVCIAF